MVELDSLVQIEVLVGLIDDSQLSIHCLGLVQAAELQLELVNLLVQVVSGSLCFSDRSINLSGKQEVFVVLEVVKMSLSRPNVHIFNNRPWFIVYLGRELLRIERAWNILYNRLLTNLFLVHRLEVLNLLRTGRISLRDLSKGS